MRILKIIRSQINKLFLIPIGIACLLSGSCSPGKDSGTAAPNIVIILADDLGYGDLGCQGHPLIRTPNIDRMAAEGHRWTSFYASSSVCNPSRAALLTGRLPYRIHKGRTTWADLPASELTMAELLKQAGYATACIGKWHLGMEDGMHPNDQGFDYFYGLTGSNDAPIRKGTGFRRTLDNVRNAGFEVFDIVLFRQKEVIEDTVRQDLLTSRYTKESVQWILEQADNKKPFFLYLAHNMPHVPIYASQEFKGHSKAGLYGDVIEELDWSVGRIMETLIETGQAENTLLVFSSDNGPWLTYYDLGGSQGHLRDGKSTAWEGGFRVPGIFWWPGTIAPAVINDIAANVDLMATVASLAGLKLPDDRTYDSYDISPVLLGKGPSDRKEWYYYSRQPDVLSAFRSGNYKMHLITRESIAAEGQGWRGYSDTTVHSSPLLFDLSTDVGERYDVSDKFPEIVKQMEEALQIHHREILQN
jgi:arylsulfatase A-like enzyme